MTALFFRPDRSQGRHRAGTGAAYPPVLTALRPLTVDRDEGTLRVRGELDLATRDLLTRAAADLLADLLADPAAGPSRVGDAGVQDVLVDAAGISFVDAAGIRSLLEIAAAAASAGGRLRVLRPSDRVRVVTGLCRLDDVLGITPSISEADR